MRARWTLLIAAFLTPALAGAQVIRGTVRSRADSGGVSGVVVLLIDSAGAVAARALSGAAGEFRIAAPMAGTYRVQTQRIGFRPDTALVTLGAGQEREQVVLLGGVAVRMDTVRVVDERVCRGSGSPESVAAEVWHQARTVLIAAQLTARQRSVEAAVVVYERTLDPNSERIRDQSSRVTSGLTVRPWTSLPPDRLHETGYIIRHRDGSFTYYAPDLDVLLSRDFVVDHCFRLVRGRDSTLVGIAFEPHRNRTDTPEIRGTLWLSRLSAELRRLEFRYDNVPADWSDRAGGDMEFARMRDGGWIIAKWMIRTPVRQGLRRGAEVSFNVIEIKAVGGELSYVRRGRDTLYSRRPLALVGAVLDSLTETPVVGARLSLVGTGLTAVTDAKGGFTIPELLPGEYTLEIRTAGYDSIGAHVAWPLMFAEGGRPPRIVIPSAAGIAAARAASLRGAVVADTTNAPIAGASVSLATLGLFALTNDAGAFRIDGIPPGTHEVTVRRLGYGPLTATLAFAPRATLERRLVLTRITILDTVVVEADSPIEEFEANRKLGLGHFVTRAQLERMRGRHLSSVIQGISGVELIRGTSLHVFLSSKRAPGSMLLEQGFRRALDLQVQSPYAWMRANGFVPDWIWCPSDDFTSRAQGLKCGCYARVYLDRMLLNPGNPTPPFDLNSLAPESLEGLEYYSNPAQMPARYQGRTEGCGVLVLHRRRT